MDKQIQLTFIKSVGILNKNIVLIAVLSALPLITLIVIAGINHFIHSYILDPLQGYVLYGANFLWLVVVYYIDIAVFTTMTILLLENKNLGRYVPVSTRRHA